MCLRNSRIGTGIVAAALTLLSGCPVDPDNQSTFRLSPTLQLRCAGVPEAEILGEVVYIRAQRDQGRTEDEVEPHYVETCATHYTDIAIGCMSCFRGIIEVVYGEEPTQ